MPINTSFSFLSEYEEVFTQCFRVSLTSENFVLKQLDNNGGVYLQLPYYYIPTDLLQIYLNPSEWLTLKNHKRHVSIVDCQVEFEFDNYRPFYNTQTKDIVVASNTNTPKFGIWRGFKNIKPHLVFVNAATYPTTEVGELLDTTAQYKALNQRLYGDSVSVNGSSHNLGAVDAICISSFVIVYSFITRKQIRYDCEDIKAQICFIFSPCIVLVNNRSYCFI